MTCLKCGGALMLTPNTSSGPCTCPPEPEHHLKSENCIFGEINARHCPVHQEHGGDVEKKERGLDILYHSLGEYVSLKAYQKLEAELADYRSVCVGIQEQAEKNSQYDEWRVSKLQLDNNELLAKYNFMVGSAQQNARERDYLARRFPELLEKTALVKLDLNECEAERERLIGVVNIEVERKAILMKENSELLTKVKELEGELVEAKSKAWHPGPDKLAAHHRLLVEENSELRARVKELEALGDNLPGYLHALVRDRNDKLEKENARLLKSNSEFREALKGLLSDTQHAEHNCGDEQCLVELARQALARERGE